jgi:hypothetical protein
MQHNKNPYTGFKDDRERRLALRSRDIRLVAIAIILAYGSSAYLPQVVR